MEKREEYDIVIMGGGLSGLTCGLYLQEAGLNVLILERGARAGGLTSSWQVHNQDYGGGKDYVLKHLDKEDIVLQYPMHMVFREKYPNLLDVYDHLGIKETNLTEPIKRFHIMDSHGVKHDFRMEDSWLPAPLHAIKTVFGLKLGIVDKLSFLLAGLPMLYLGNSLNRQHTIDSFSDQVSMESFLEKAWVTERARDFIASFVPSIYNLDSIEVNARRMAAVTMGTLFMSQRGMWYQLVNDNYTPGTVVPLVKRFTGAGGTLKLNCDVRRIIHDETGVRKILYQNCWKEYQVICPVCGSQQYVKDEGFCKTCGLKWSDRDAYPLSNTSQIRIRRPRSNLPAGEGLRRVTAKYYVAAMRGHQLVPLLDPESPLLAHTYFQNLGREKGACLSIARIFYDRKITDENFITGTSRRMLTPDGRRFSFNGCQDIGNIMERYGRYPGSVIDILSDRAEATQILPVKTYLDQVIEDIPVVWPKARQAKVKLALGAHIRPPVLYHKEVPRLPGERNRFAGTPLANLFACNCSLGLIGIGMESAYQSGKLAANRILELSGKPTVRVYGYPHYDIGWLSKIAFNVLHGLVKTKKLLGRIITSV